VYDLFPLEMLPIGEVASIADVVGEPHHIQRLHELGLHAGATIEVVQSGTPCIVRVGGSKLCLREGADVTVLVTRGNES
jgi:ferrous iron transport protein A